MKGTQLQNLEHTTEETTGSRNYHSYSRAVAMALPIQYSLLWISQPLHMPCKLFTKFEDFI
jgi:hypothetical protein